MISIISDSKISASLRSAEMYLEAVEQAISIEKMNDSNLNPNSCDITSGNLECEGTKIKVEVKGETPIKGDIILKKGKINNLELIYNDYKIVEKDQKGNLVYVEKLEPGLYDKNDKLIANWDTLVNEYGLNIEKEYQSHKENGTMYYLLNNYNELSSGVKVVISDSVTKIGRSTFYECKNLENVIVPSSIKSIGLAAFMGCTNLTSIELPNKMTNIAEYAFFGSRLTSINLPYGIPKISNYTFTNCDKLTTIIIPDTVTEIGSNAFMTARKIETVIYMGTQDDWNKIIIKDNNQDLTNKNIIFEK